ncbi:MAG TPA: Cys-Gln thioester bond-forming surface protein [Candidatus Onthousia excrementipullorum]|uniref:Cys-Gln thioester bond-forming surface protein n=1 Tax=Candidatus Onthousia excrementipullorum TaxID=2840884 RepID=A0A9D1J3B8_9FIRM|nr:Cys-Gln thioester bond-forming surface protein [Candidatus Onthousia excrementipullorum]
MIKKISNLFKKGNNDWLKVTVSIVISAVMVIFFSKTVASSYAFELPDTLTSGIGSNAERITLFEELDGDEQLNLVPYYATDEFNNKYTIYCLDKDKEWASGYTITKDSEPLNAGYSYIVQNGYPTRSLTGNDAYDNYLTQIAVWWYQDLSEGTNNLTTNQKNVIERSDYYRYIEPLINGAVNAKNNLSEAPTFNIMGGYDVNLSEDGQYLVTDYMNVVPYPGIDSFEFSISVNNAAALIEDEYGHILNNGSVLGSYKRFRLKIDLSKINDVRSIEVNAAVNYTLFEAYSYKSSNSLVQRAMPSVIATTVYQAQTGTRVDIPTGSLTISKIDNQTFEPLSGANIEVRNAYNNQVVASFTTNGSDYTINNLLPGKYKIIETSAPKGYYITESSSDVIIDTSSLETSTTIFNDPYNVRIRKVDSTTGAPVAGAVLKVLDSNNNEVYRFTSTNGYVSIPNLTEGTYSVEEVSAPDGYVLNTEVKKFTINSSNPNVTVDFEDEENEVIIEKRDASDKSMLSGATLRLVRVSDNSTIDEWTTTTSGHVVRGLAPGNYKVIETKAPSGYTLSSSEVTFTVTNNQTEPLTVTFYNSKNQVSIVKVDMETGARVSGATLQVTNSSGGVVDTFTTSDTPHVLSKLSPGTYYVRETKTPDGYVLDSEPVSFTISDSTTNLQVEFKNKKNEIRLGKIDKDTKEYVAGALLRLVDSNGDEVERFTSGSEPSVIKRGLKSGTYYLEELEAPDGYIRNTGRVTVTIKDTDDVVTYTIANKKTKVTISKVDSETGEPVSGVILEILDSNKKSLKTFTTTDSPTVISDLNEGTYYVREVKAADGYILDKSLHEFTLDSKTPEVNIEIENKPIILNLGKIDARTGEYISGATMQLNREDGDMNPITFVSSDSPYTVKRLSPGIYSLTEVEAPDGYVGTGSKITFEVLETGKVQTVNISNDVTTISVSNRKLVVDAEEGYKYRLETRDGVVVDEFKTTKEGYISDGLELGDYVLKQLDTPNGVIVNSNPIYFSVTDSNEVSVINYVNDFTKVEISKKDMANSEEIEGAHLVIRDSNGEVVEEWTSTDTPHYIEKLPVGSYTLTETIAPDGYVLNASTVTFEVLESGDIQSTTMFNSRLVEVPNTGSNATYIYLVGGLLIIIGGSLMYISYKNKNKKKSRKNI